MDTSYMHFELRNLCICVLVLAALSGCATQNAGRAGSNQGDAQARPLSEREQNIRLMLSFDGNSDGAVARDEVESALRRQFASVEVNGDGRLDLQEMQVENDRRYKAFGTGASPLIDWNQNGQIEFDEFATTARSLFAETDLDSDGLLDGSELRLPTFRGPVVAPPMPEMGRGRGRLAPPF